MQSFRSEIENPIVAQDIIDLEKKIRLFREGKADEEKFHELSLCLSIVRFFEILTERRDTQGATVVPYPTRSGISYC